ncbi:hypothetical protein DFS33DRAFT_1367347 [Desarmillaria ectypa]|nr:hypothetical protein DFS33DRAFT_1367347 [Desarmillaria ectypa]
MDTPLGPDKRSPCALHHRSYRHLPTRFTSPAGANCPTWPQSRCRQTRQYLSAADPTNLNAVIADGGAPMHQGALSSKRLEYKSHSEHRSSALPLLIISQFLAIVFYLCRRICTSPSAFSRRLIFHPCFLSLSLLSIMLKYTS